MNQTSFLLPSVSNKIPTVAESKAGQTSEALETEGEGFLAQLTQLLSNDSEALEDEGEGEGDVSLLNMTGSTKAVMTDPLLELPLLEEGADLDLDPALQLDAALREKAKAQDVEVLSKSSNLSDTGLAPLNKEEMPSSGALKEGGLNSDDAKALLKHLNDSAQALKNPPLTSEQKNAQGASLPPEGKPLPFESLMGSDEINAVPMDASLEKGNQAFVHLQAAQENGPDPRLVQDTLKDASLVKEPQKKGLPLEAASVGDLKESLSVTSKEIPQTLETDLLDEHALALALKQKETGLSQSDEEVKLSLQNAQGAFGETEKAQTSPASTVNSISTDLPKTQALHSARLKEQGAELHALNEEENPLGSVLEGKRQDGVVLQKERFIPQFTDPENTPLMNEKASRSAALSSSSPLSPSNALHQGTAFVSTGLPSSLQPVQTQQNTPPILSSAAAFAAIPWTPVDVSRGSKGDLTSLLNGAEGLSGTQMKTGSHEPKGDQFAQQLALSLGHQNSTTASRLDTSVTQSPLQLSQNQTEVAEALTEKVNIMLSKNLKQIDIRLDPPELGRMQIKLSMNQDQASVQFTVANQNVREMVEQSMPRLREMMNQQGLQLSQSSVQQQDADGRQAFSESHGQQGQYSERQNGKNNGLHSARAEQDAESEHTSSIRHELNISAPSERVDYYA